MAEHKDEVAQITRTAKALALNLGNITDARMASMPIALETASRSRVPVMLDLVGTACSSLRKAFAGSLMRLSMPSILKGNMSELLAMAGEVSHGVGIDAGSQDSLTEENRMDLARLFMEKAAQWDTVIFITGKEDLIISPHRCLCVKNGTPAMTRITGTGCMAGMICATYLAAADPLEAAFSAALEFSIAGELAEENSKGPGSFQNALLDAFYLLDPQQIREKADYQILFDS